MPQLQLKLFAGFRLLNQKGKVLSGLSRKAKALLAWLALNPDHEHPHQQRRWLSGPGARDPRRDPGTPGRGDRSGPGP